MFRYSSMLYNRQREQHNENDNNNSFNILADSLLSVPPLDVKIDYPKKDLQKLEQIEYVKILRNVGPSKLSLDMLFKNAIKKLFYPEKKHIKVVTETEYLQNIGIQKSRITGGDPRNVVYWVIDRNVKRASVLVFNLKTSLNKYQEYRKKMLKYYRYRSNTTEYFDRYTIFPLRRTMLAEYRQFDDAIVLVPIDINGRRSPKTETENIHGIFFLLKESIITLDKYTSLITNQEKKDTFLSYKKDIEDSIYEQFTIKLYYFHINDNVLGRILIKSKHVALNYIKLAELFQFVSTRPMDSITNIKDLYIKYIDVYLDGIDDYYSKKDIHQDFNGIIEQFQKDFKDVDNEIQNDIGMPLEIQIKLNQDISNIGISNFRTENLLIIYWSEEIWQLNEYLFEYLKDIETTLFKYIWHKEHITEIPKQLTLIYNELIKNIESHKRLYDNWINDQLDGMPEHSKSTIVIPEFSINWIISIQRN